MLVRDVFYDEKILATILSIILLVDPIGPFEDNNNNDMIVVVAIRLPGSLS